MNMKRYSKLRKMLDVLNNFAEQHKGLLDDRSKAELAALKKRIEEMLAAFDSELAGVVVARTERDTQFKALQKAIVELKKAIEWVVARDGTSVLIPRLGTAFNNPARIHILGEKLCKTAGQAGKDPVLAKTAAALRAALEGYTESYSDAYDKSSSSRTNRKTADASLATLNGLVNGYRLMLTYRTSGNDRQALLNLLAASLPRKSRNAGASVQPAATAGATQPQLPLMPTVVPQSSEHPSISANA